MDIIDEFIEDISSWDSFFIVYDEQSDSLAGKFSETLDSLEIDNILIGIEDSNMLKDNLNFGDIILAMSSSGEDESILNMVKFSKSMNVKVYAICDKFSNLAMLADEILETDGDFKDSVMEIIDTINEKLGKNLKTNTPRLITGGLAAIPRVRYVRIINKNSLQINYGFGIIFIYVDSKNYDVASRLSDKIQSCGGKSYIFTEKLYNQFKDNLNRDGTRIRLPSGEKYDDSKDTFRIFISQHCEEDFPINIKDADFVICGEKCQKLTRRQVAVGTENFKENSIKYIDNLNINVPKEKHTVFKVRDVMIISLIILIIICFICFLLGGYPT